MSLFSPFSRLHLRTPSLPPAPRPARRSSRPGRLCVRPLAARPAPRPAAPPVVPSAPLAIEEAIRQWVDANPLQLYRGGA